MISGQIDNLNHYFGPEIVRTIVKFLEKSGREQIMPGKHVLDQGINAIVIKTSSRTIQNQKFEAHQKYLDLHCLLSGKEVIAFTSTKSLEVTESYNTEHDYELFNYPSNYSQLELQPRQFVLLYPDDAHCAQGYVQQEQQISKIVFKIPIATLNKSTILDLREIKNLEEALPILWDHDQKNQQINFPSDSPNKELFEQNIRSSYTDNPRGFFLLYNQERVIGSLLLRIKHNPYRNQKYGEIWYIYLEPECRGKGYGIKLLEHADEYFKQQGCNYAFAGISATNPGSNALFEKSGYTQTRIMLEKQY